MSTPTREIISLYARAHTLHYLGDCVYDWAKENDELNNSDIEYILCCVREAERAISRIGNEERWDLTVQWEEDK